MAVQLQINPRAAHVAFTKYAANAARLMTAASHLGQSGQQLSNAQLGAELAAFHADGRALLANVLASGTHAVRFEHVLTAPGVGSILGRFSELVSELGTREARGAIDRAGHAAGLNAIASDTQKRLSAIIDITQAILASIEEHPDFPSSAYHFLWRRRHHVRAERHHRRSL